MAKKNKTQKAFIHCDDPVFKILNPNYNTRLSMLSGIDLQDLIILIDECYLQLRNGLGFDNTVTFGLEIEFEYAMEERIRSELNKTFHGSWRIVEDGSLKDGAEINSPILRDTEKTWGNLARVCDIVSPLAKIDARSGGHIHIATQTLGSDKNAWLNFIKLLAVYEKIIFRFTYGNFLTARPSLEQYAKPVAKTFLQDYAKLKKENASLAAIISAISRQRYQAVNFNNVKRGNCHHFVKDNTIEFRCPNGTLEAPIWQNNVNLFVRLLKYSKSSCFDDDTISKRQIINEDKYNDIKWYDEIYLEEALELCDLVFKNNFDKVYFLRQYLKSFQVNKNGKNYTKAHKLSKNGIKKIY